MNLHEELEEIYSFYNDRRFVHPDPLEFLYDFPSLKDREIAGLIAALFAYGRVQQILKSVEKILKVIEKPYDFLLCASESDLKVRFKGFVHRFTTEEELLLLLVAIKRIIKKFGTLGQCFFSIYDNNEENILNSLIRFIKIIGNSINNKYNSLISNPNGSSALKRFNLFLRWMVRRDNVDPGGWDFVSPSRLLVPLDTHMFRICDKFDFTKRKQAGMKTVLEITSHFKALCPEDPVKYDFALTRLGMHNKKRLDSLICN